MKIFNACIVMHSAWIGGASLKKCAKFFFALAGILWKKFLYSLYIAEPLTGKYVKSRGVLGGRTFAGSVCMCCRALTIGLIWNCSCCWLVYKTLMSTTGNVTPSIAANTIQTIQSLSTSGRYGFSFRPNKIWVLYVFWHEMCQSVVR